MSTVRTGSGGHAFNAIGESPLRVAVVVEACGGGSARHVAELSEGLLQRGCEVHLLYSPLRADLSFTDAVRALPGLHLMEVPMRREPHPSDVACLLQIRRYIRRNGAFDIVHAHSSKAGALARVAALGVGAASVYTPHAIRTMDPTLHPAVHQFYRLIEVALARSTTDAIIAVSDAERQHIIRLGVAAGKMHVVPNGIPAMPAVDRPKVRSSLGLAPQDVCLGFIGRLVPQKAPERFITIIARLAQRLPQVRGVVVGSGPLEAAVHGLADDLGIADRIIWVTNQPGPQVLPAFDTLVLPSLYEGMPYVLLEALAAGVPVVSTDVGGVAEAISSGETGFIVPQDNIDALLAKIGLLIEDEALRRQMAQTSLRKSGEMSVERMVEQTLQLYRHALSDTQVVESAVPVGLDPKRAG